MIDLNDISEKTSGFGIGEAGQVAETSIEAEIEAAQLQPRRKPDYPEGRRLSCGCTVYHSHEVMSASLGSSCFNCYDRMSDV